MYVFILFLLAIILLPKPAFGDTVFSGSVEKAVPKDNSIEFTLSDCLFNIYIIDSNIIRFRYTQKDKFSEAPSYGVTENCVKKTNFSFKKNLDSYELKTDELDITITKKPCRIEIRDNSGNIINQDEPYFGVSFDGNEVRCYKNFFKDEQFFGLGEKTGFLGRKGQQYTMWNSDIPFYTKEQDPLYASIPFFTGLKDNKAYGIFFDNTYRSYFCMGAGNDRFYWFGADGGEMDYYFIYGPEMKRVISSYTDLTGKMSLPPMWALGYQQSRWSYSPEKKVREIAENFRKKDIPCDVIYLDIDYMDGYRVFTWDKEKFPEPEKMISELKKEGFKIIPIIDPGVKADDKYHMAKEGIEKELFVKYPDGTLYKGEVWPSWAYFPDFTNEKTKIWWSEKLSMMLNLGVEGFWNDMNEPAVWGKYMPDIVKFNDYGYGGNHKKIHNVYALEMAKATLRAVKASGKRHFILTRAGFSGIQKYAALWTGDNFSNEDHLLMACLIPQSLGLSGLPFTGSDAGGFGGNPSENLYIRWMELGAFTPFFRGHACSGTPQKEPWALGEKVEDITRKSIKLRYRFLPYLYNEFYNASKTGLPIMRPLFLNYQDDAECYKDDCQKQFMIGENLLAAPVLNENDLSKKLYLPNGRWISFDDNKIYDGNQWITVEAPLEKIPLFIREGGVIVLQESQNYTGEKEIGEYEFRIFPSKASCYELYEDDGISYDYEKGIYSISEIKIEKVKENSIEVSFKKKYNKYDSKKKDYLFKIYDMKKPSKVTVSGRTLKKYNSEKKIEEEGFYFDSKSGMLIVKVKASDEFIIKTL